MTSVVRPPCDEGVMQAGVGSTNCPRSAAPWVLSAAVIGSSMVFIDGTVANVALPAIQRDLGASATDAQWVVEAYALLLASLLLVGGALGDLYGRRRIFRFGVVLFAGSSALCGIAPDPRTLIAARALQGAAGALLTPGSLALISAAYDDDSRGRAIGTWSAATSITASLGPVLGGALIQYASWRWAFFLNVPLGIVVLLIIAARVPESRDEMATGAPDILGGVLASVGLALLVYGLIRSDESGFADAVVVASMAGGAVILVLFGVLEARLGKPRAGRKRRSPMLPFDVFRSRPFTVTNGLTLLLYGALGGSLFFVPFSLIEVHGYTATAAGAALLPMILLLASLSRLTGGLVPRVGARRLLTVGPAVAAIGFWLFAIPGASGNYWTTFFPAAVVLGLGMSITVAPLTATVMGSVERRHAGVASGINNAVSRAAALLAVAIFGIVLVHGFNTGVDDRLSNLHVSSAVVQSIDSQRSKLALARAPEGTDPAQASAANAAVADAFVGAFRTVMMIAGGLAVASALVAFVGLRQRPEPVYAPRRAPAPATE
jgi:EmrB/QacA subfamily drug resistance transporter